MRREIELGTQPRLDGMLVGCSDVREMAGNDRTRVSANYLICDEVRFRQAGHLQSRCPGYGCRCGNRSTHLKPMSEGWPLPAAGAHFVGTTLCSRSCNCGANA